MGANLPPLLRVLQSLRSLFGSWYKSYTAAGFDAIHFAASHSCLLAYLQLLPRDRQTGHAAIEPTATPAPGFIYFPTELSAA
ncbi:hypothetical protein VTN96DRAFT_7432 [Rasamsonia emersonii]